MPNPHELPALGHLACFEAAARNLSFKAASAELSITPAAVSHRIKALELDLGQPLFIRNHRGVELTESGALLFLATQRGFEEIAEGILRIRGRRDASGVTVAATTAMAGLWLTPQLAEFWNARPEVTISQVISDTEVAEGADLSIRYGNPNQRKEETHELFRDRIVALGTRQFADKYTIKTREDLQRVPLVHVDAGVQPWTNWAEWLASFDLGAPQGPWFTLNNYLVALKSAEDHVGAVLGWQKLSGDALGAGGLVQLTPGSMDAPWPFYLCIHSHASANARKFARWLLAQTPDAP